MRNKKKIETTSWKIYKKNALDKFSRQIENFFFFFSNTHTLSVQFYQIIKLNKLIYHVYF